MPRTVSATEMKNRFGSLADWAVESQDDVIVESRGTPKVAVIAFEEYERLRRWREEARRRELLDRFRALREEIRERNRNLTKEEADALAERLGREMVEALIEEGKINYEGG
ncbi:MAG: type II toxin-antitoxin system prevent-host-death family antitoxin [Anaerolineales bacterium]